MRLLPGSSLLLLSIAAACVSTPNRASRQATSKADNAADEEPGDATTAAVDLDSDASSRLLINNPYFSIAGEKVTWVGVSLDGRDLGQCDPSEKRKQCIEEVELLPGAHVIHVALSHNHWQAHRVDLFAADRLIVPGRVSITFDVEAFLKGSPDLAKPLATVSQVGSYFTGTGSSAKATSTKVLKPGPVNPCLVALEKIAHAAGCHADELAAVAADLRGAKRACRDLDDAPKLLKERVASLLPALLNPLQTELSSCIDPAVADRVAPFMRQHGREFWPIDTVEGSSWSWSRDVVKGDPPDLEKLQDVLAVYEDHYDKAQQRVAVVDELLALYAEPDEKLARALYAKAMKAAWSYDPTLPAGHRMFALVHLMSTKAKAPFPMDPAFVRHIAERAKADKSLHCGVQRRVEGLLSLFERSEDSLSAEEWETMKALISRTPKDERLSGCERAVKEGAEGAAVHAERWNWLKTFDCAAGRDPDVRGSSLGYTPDDCERL